MIIDEVGGGNYEKIILQFSQTNEKEIESLLYITNKLLCRLDKFSNGWLLQLNIYQLNRFLNECRKQNFTRHEINSLNKIMDSKKIIWSGKNFNFNLTYDPIICSIVNCTPDSFFDSEKFNTNSEILNKIESDLSEGASLIELGGKSTRPHHVEVSASEEWRRLEPIIKNIKNNFSRTVLSIDTNSSFVMRNALDKYDVDIINDIDGFENKDKLRIVNEYRPSIVLMNNGRDGTKRVPDQFKYFNSKLAQLSSFGLKKSRIVIDPGIGFSLNGNPAEDMIRIKSISKLNQLHLPTMIAISRKSFMGKLFDLDLNSRLISSIVLENLMMQSGGRILRVHDVKETKKLIDVVDSYENTILEDNNIVLKK
ncbi:dihydropteroate synthase [Companilactobacillus huachuanensis]|uniref:Dihydropteroate synthase n=1 Tax=Companilactobacillus huachuanensis TaxID=2559914 RepID=A0ABW1RNQ0_9LACO|nr:dihydropteroate synthase [Companilactobacillus huachuanensis]